ncbi:hypothetical protein ACWD48_07475 [Streptomyces sp. NPDC002519]
MTNHLSKAGRRKPAMGGTNVARCPMFHPCETSAVPWRWPKPSCWLFELLTEPTPEAFQACAEDYYETTVDLEAVRQVDTLRPLDHALITRLNTTAAVKDAVREAITISYPVDPALSPESS